QVLRPVVAVVEVGDGVPGQVADRVLAADHLAPERVVGEDCFGQGHVDAVVGGVEAGGQLVQDDVALDLDVVLVERGVHHDVDQQVHRHRQLGGGHPGVEGR